MSAPLHDDATPPVGKEDFGCALCAAKDFMLEKLIEDGFEALPLIALALTEGAIDGCRTLGVARLVAEMCPAHRARFEQNCADTADVFARVRPVDAAKGAS